MRRPSRRELLRGSVGLVALTAGCIADDADEAGGGGSPGADGDDDGDEDETDADNAGSDADESESSTDDERITSVSVRHDAAGTEPDVVLFRDREDADAWLEERDLEDGSPVAFVDETIFEEASLVALEAGAPTPCYELVLEDPAIDEGVLELEAAVSDDSAAEESCVQQESTVGRLVRASVDGVPVTELSATIVDREGAEHGFGANVEREEESASDAESGTETESDSESVTESEGESADE